MTILRLFPSWIFSHPNASEIQASKEAYRFHVVDKYGGFNRNFISRMDIGIRNQAVQGPAVGSIQASNYLTA